MDPSFKFKIYKNRFDKRIQGPLLEGAKGADKYLNFTPRKWEYKKTVNFKKNIVKNAPPGLLKQVKKMFKSGVMFGLGNRTPTNATQRIDFNQQNVGRIKHLLIKNLAIGNAKTDVFTNIGGQQHVPAGAVQHITLNELKGGRLMTEIRIKQKDKEDVVHIFESIQRKRIIPIEKKNVIEKLDDRIRGAVTGVSEALTTFRERYKEGGQSFRSALQATRDTIKLGNAKRDASMAEKNFRYEIDTNSLRMIVNDETTYRKDPQRWIKLARRANLDKRNRNMGLSEDQIYMYRKHAAGF